MNRDDIKRAADALGRLEALEEALADAARAPREALPVSFVSVGGVEDDSVCGVVRDEREEYRTERYPLLSDHGIKAYYPRHDYVAVIELLAQRERATLGRLGVKL